MSEVRLIDANSLTRAMCIKFYTTPYYKHILDVIENAPTVELPKCQDCEYLKFTEQFVGGVVETMNKNGISGIEELERIIKGDGQ